MTLGSPGIPLEVSIGPVISISKACPVPSIRMDDRAASGQCTLMRISFTGTIGILKAAFQEGLISLSQADDILSKMIKTGFYSPIRSISDIV